MSPVSVPLCLLLGSVLSGLAAGQELSLSDQQTRAVLNAGVSYDLLRDPTAVSFAYPEGYMSMNIPLNLTTNSVDFGSLAPQVFGKDSSFFPTFGAVQRPNFSFRINVPMLRGVCTYAQTRNVEFDYDMKLENVQFFMDSTIPDNAHIRLRGLINAPLRYSMGWSTQTFGYAFKPLRDMVVAVNLNRHLFEMELNGLVSVDVLGKVNVLNPQMQGIELPAISYDADRTYGIVTGRFTNSAWSPTVGLKWWRVGLTARIGVGGAADGFFYMKYAVPFFIDKNTFMPDLSFFNFAPGGDSAGGTDSGTPPVDFVQLLSDLSNARVDSIKNISDSALHFNIPSGFTLSFDILKDSRLFVSYTYVHGEISGLHNRVTPAFGRSQGTTIDDLNFGIDVNHVILLGGRYKFTKFNLGAFLMDFRWREQANLLETFSSKLGLPGAPVPILNFSATFGTTTRGLLELDLLPIPSLKTGVLYYF